LRELRKTLLWKVTAPANSGFAQLLHFDFRKLFLINNIYLSRKYSGIFAATDAKPQTVSGSRVGDHD
jgi:hypothetical protein